MPWNSGIEPKESRRTEMCAWGIIISNQASPTSQLQGKVDFRPQILVTSRITSDVLTLFQTRFSPHDLDETLNTTPDLQLVQQNIVPRNATSVNAMSGRGHHSAKATTLADTADNEAIPDDQSDPGRTESQYARLTHRPPF